MGLCSFLFKQELQTSDWPSSDSCGFQMVMEILLSKQEKIFLLVSSPRPFEYRALLKRKHMPLPDYQCVFCNSGIDEDIFHLLFHCPFSLACWSNLQLIIPNSQDVGFIVESIKRQLHLPFFMEVLISMCWSI